MKASRGISQMIPCAYCGKESRRAAWEIRRSKRLYCSRECFDQHKRTTDIVKGKNSPIYQGVDTSFVCKGCGKLSYKRCKANMKSENLFCSHECDGLYRRSLTGENAAAWRGGLTTVKHTIRTNITYAEWRTKVYERDNYTCQKCYNGSNQLIVHHLIGLRQIIHDNNIQTMDDALKVRLLWDATNGVTMCKDCHKEFHAIYGRYKFTIEDFQNYTSVKKVA
jgi:5-methylcytosine-specific restriction endonuclease McrA